MPKRLVILIAYGPEARAFLQSGLAERLATDYELVFAATASESSALRGAPGLVTAAPQAVEPQRLTRVRRLRGRTAPRSWRGVAARVAESMAASLFGGSPCWRQWLREVRADLVLAGSYSSARTLPALESAAQLGIPCVVLANSPKDVHRKPHCGPQLAGLGVFSESERRAFLAANPGRSASNVRSIGSLHCAALLRAPVLARNELCRSLGLDPRRPYVCYSAAQDRAMEQPLLERLSASLARLPERPQLVVRLNPMDPALWFSPRQNPAGIVFDQPRWSWDSAREWICPLPSDGPAWASLLSHAAVAVSRPSTVVWEAAALGKRTVTVAWGDSRNAWHAADFSEARRRGWVRGVKQASLLGPTIRAELLEPRPPAAPPATDTVERAGDLVRGVVDPAGGRASIGRIAVTAGAQ